MPTRSLRIRRRASVSAAAIGEPKQRIIRGMTKKPTAIPPSLNIKNAETCQLIHELAELTGESMTSAVTTAVRERLHHLREQAKGDLADRLLAIGRECAARFGDEYRSLDHDALLYDEKGLPR
jgi:antitoxin VapB